MDACSVFCSKNSIGRAGKENGSVDQKDFINDLMWKCNSSYVPPIGVSTGVILCYKSVIGVLDLAECV